jgi:hypothetical protein
MCVYRPVRKLGSVQAVVKESMSSAEGRARGGGGR